MSATLAFALRSTFRAASRHVQSQARIGTSRRGYASVQGTAHQAAHKAGSDLPWLVTSAVISIPTLAYLIVNGPEKKSHDEHKAEAADEHGVVPAKPQEEIGEGHEPIPTSHTDTGDAESKGHVVGYKPKGVSGGHEDSEEGAQPQDNVAADQAKNESRKGDENLEETPGMSSNDAAAGRSAGKSSNDAKNPEPGQNKRDTSSGVDGSGKEREKKSTDESNEGGLGAGKKGQGSLNDDQESQEKTLSDKPDSKRVDPTEK